MTENRHLDRENIDRDISEVEASDRHDGISADQQWGTGVNEGQVHNNDMEDQLREDLGIDADANAHQDDHFKEGNLEEELQDDIGLRDGKTDRESVDR